MKKPLESKGSDKAGARHELDSRNEYLGGDPVFQRPTELAILRRSVRKVAQQEMGMTAEQVAKIYTDYECDKIIAVTAPEVRSEWLRQQIESKLS